jgi:hypothetical protein
VPLDQILTTQRDVLALQHVIQRELAATHSRLQVVAGGVPAAAAQQPPPLLPPDWATGELLSPEGAAISRQQAHDDSTV